MIQEALPDLSSQSEKTNLLNRDQDSSWAVEAEANRASRLIAFPGASRSVPEWRRQLSQRVREVQEKKAREAAEELAAAQEAGLVSCALPSGQLELVPDLEQPVMNPIVSKALERLDRARRSEGLTDCYGAATAAALAVEIEDPQSQEVVEPSVAAKPRLTVVAPATASESAEPIVERETLALTVETEASPTPTAETAERKPARIISEDDVVLSYLDTCLSLPAVEGDTRTDLPGLTRRFFGGVLDLIFVALMVSPAYAAVYYTGGKWTDRNVIEMLSAVTAATIFAYMTVTVALTGRTLAMRMLSLKTIDLRTGLIPTGGQAIKRALGFVFSLAFLGFGQIYALIDRDGRTVYDRISNTIVVRT
jgi:uncharacterized RDD family membrane protein YckC